MAKILFPHASYISSYNRPENGVGNELLRLISIHQFLARARLFPSDILQSHGAYQITLQLHLRKTRASKYSHLLPTRNVFSGGKANSPPALKAKLAAVIVRVASGFCCRNILIFLKVEGRN